MKTVVKTECFVEVMCMEIDSLEYFSSLYLVV